MQSKPDCHALLPGTRTRLRALGAFRPIPHYPRMEIVFILSGYCTKQGFSAPSAATVIKWSALVVCMRGSEKANYNCEIITFRERCACELITLKHWQTFLLSDAVVYDLLYTTLARIMTLATCSLSCSFAFQCQYRNARRIGPELRSFLLGGDIEPMYENTKLDRSCRLALHLIIH